MLVWKRRTKYFDARTRKLDKAKIATDLIDHVHALPGRFLKQDGKAGLSGAGGGGGGGKQRQQQVWVEIGEKAAKKKVGQAFRDITPHDERYRIGAGLPVEAEQSSSDEDDDDERSHEEEGEDNDPYGQHGDGAASASAAAAAGYYPEVSNNGTATSAAAALAYSMVGRKHSLDDGEYDEHRCGGVAGESVASAPNADLPTTPPLPPLPVVPMMYNPPPSLHGHAPQQGGGGGLPTHHHHSHKVSRLPASEFALYPQGHPGVGGDDSDAKFAGGDNEDGDGEGRQQHQSRRGSTESTDALETLTVELLVERARTWEELYYSERDYSRSLEERLLRLLEGGGRVGPPMPVPVPKRRKVGDTEALAA